MTFLKTLVERYICTFVGITLGRTLMPDERLNRLLGRTPDIDQLEEEDTMQSKQNPRPAEQQKSNLRPK
jgi:hypothetical protein